MALKIDKHVEQHEEHKSNVMRDFDEWLLKYLYTKHCLVSRWNEFIIVAMDDISEDNPIILCSYSFLSKLASREEKKKKNSVTVEPYPSELLNIE